MTISATASLSALSMITLLAASAAAQMGLPFPFQGAIGFDGWSKAMQRRLNRPGFFGDSVS